jgi:hypothetical protein
MPPPDFWAMMVPFIWGQFLIIHTEFHLEAVEPDQQWADTLLYVTAGLFDNVTCF